MELLTGVFSAFGLSASAGLNAYIPLLAVSLLAKFTNLIELQSPWDTLTSWWVIGAIIVLGAIEFFADKIPAVNHVNDIIQTFVRPVAGAILFAASAKVITDMSPILSMISGLFVSGSVHTVKSAAIRPAVTAFTGGVGHTPVSIAEDIIATFLSILAILIPIIIGIILVLVITTFIWAKWRKANALKAG
ncbi:MAG: DUF4126 domain-containing protein [Anaerolineae bacterium]|jgi:hypothetical protein|nr:DUF4126 domain-containing protein [Anaerolineae bacterium]MBT7073597.1 DUF4126 domain-containing protein [Anaerolineae bacterium]